MKVRDYLLDEIKRLNRQNDLLEKQVNKSEFVSIPVYETINKKYSSYVWDSQSNIVIRLQDL